MERRAGRRSRRRPDMPGAANTRRGPQVFLSSIAVAVSTYDANERLDAVSFDRMEADATRPDADAWESADTRDEPNSDAATEACDADDEANDESADSDCSAVDFDNESDDEAFDVEVPNLNADSLASDDSDSDDSDSDDDDSDDDDDDDAISAVSGIKLHTPLRHGSIFVPGSLMAARRRNRQRRSSMRLRIVSFKVRPRADGPGSISDTPWCKGSR